jgi:uncharacterized integral membrane protein (TIGR00697 family)
MFMSLVALFALMCLAVLLAASRGRTALFALSIGLVLATNIALAKKLDVFGIVVPLGVIPFSFLYIVNDIFVTDGKPNEAYVVAVGTMVAQLLFTAFTAVLLAFPVVQGDAAQPAIERILGVTPRITAAGTVATLGSFVNVWAFSRLTRIGSAFMKLDLVRGNLATAVGELVNSFLFILIGYYGVLPNLMAAIIVTWLSKVAVAFLGMPVLAIGRSMLTRQLRHKRTHEALN